jgi:HNH endonuclease
MTPKQLKRFRQKFEKDEQTGCWVWTGAQNGWGYGRLVIEGSPHMAHRAAYEHWVGPIPKGMEIHHTCFTRLCVNPYHLTLVTRLEHAAIRRKGGEKNEG